MSTYPPENDSPNDTPIYSRSVSDPSLDEQGLDEGGLDDLDRDVLDADTPKPFPGVHVPSFGSDTSGSDDRSGAVDPFGEPDAIVPEAGGSLSTPPVAAPARTTAGSADGSDWSLAASSDTSHAPDFLASSSSPDTADSTATGTAGAKETAEAKADAAKGAAKDVAGDAKSAASDVAGTTKDQAKRVASEATDHAKQLYGQASEGLKEQAGQQQERAAGGLRTLSDQLSSMADKSEDDGIAQKVVRDLSHRAGSFAGFLEGRDPGSLLDEVKSYAARKPGTFIAIAAGAGILAGRLTKALAAETKHEHEQDGPTV